MSSLVKLVRLELESVAKLEAIAELEVVSPARLESSKLVRLKLDSTPVELGSVAKLESWLEKLESVRKLCCWSWWWNWRNLSTSVLEYSPLCWKCWAALATEARKAPLLFRKAVEVAVGWKSQINILQLF